MGDNNPYIILSNTVIIICIHQIYKDITLLQKQILKKNE